MTRQSEIMDELEKLMVLLLKPTIRELFKSKNYSEKELDEKTRILISKIGLRIGFGGDIYDEANSKRMIADEKLKKGDAVSETTDGHCDKINICKICGKVDITNSHECNPNRELNNENNLK